MNATVVRRVLLALAMLMFLSAAPAAQAQQTTPVVEPAASSIYLPIVAHQDGWDLTFDIVRLDGQICTTALNAAGSTATPANVCVPAGTYIAMRENNAKHVFFGGQNVLESSAGVVLSTATGKPLLDVLMSNYVPGDATFPTQGNGIVYEVDLAHLRPEFMAAGAAAIPFDWGTFMLGWNRTLGALTQLDPFMVGTHTPISNFPNTQFLYPDNCGMSGLKVRVLPALWGHSTNPPRAKLSSFLSVILDNQGNERPVTSSEQLCMIPQPETTSPLNFQYVGFDRLLDEPSFATYKQKVDAEVEKMEYYLPSFDFFGSPPLLPTGKQWGIAVQALGETAVVVIVGWYTKGAGLTSLRMFIFGPGACITEFADLGICEMQTTPGSRSQNFLTGGEK